jgi:hypothetical protein
MKNETPTKPGLVFVYNAESGLFNTVADIAHKVFSPETYQCNLCALTHSTFGMRESWQEFLNGLEMPFEFLHADELRNRYSINDIPLPAVFKKHAERLTLSITADSINRCLTIDELKHLVRNAVLTGSSDHTPGMAKLL